MNFSFAIARLKDGTAAKRPNWSGYIKRVDGTGGAYDIVFVKRNGTTATFAVSAAGVVTTSSTMTLDATLMEGMLATDWIVDTVANCEADRSGSGVW